MGIMDSFGDGASEFGMEERSAVSPGRVDFPDEDIEEISDVEHEEYHAGMQDATADGVPQKRKINFVMIGILLVALVGMLVFVATRVIGSRTVEEPAKLNLEDEQFKKMLAEREELEKRLKIAEEQARFEKSEMDKRFENLMKMLSDAEEKRLRELEERDRLLREEMERLRQQQRPAPEVQVPVKTEPLKGNTSKTIAFDTTKATLEARAKEAEAARLALNATAYANRIDSEPGLPASTFVDAVLETKMVSLYSQIGAENWIRARVKSDVPVEKGFTIPAGTVFIGKATPDYLARRMTVELTKMIVGSVEIEIKGVLLDKRGNVGMVTRYVDPKQRAIWSSIIPNMLSAIASGMIETKSVYVKNSSGEEYYEDVPKRTLENAALEGASKTLQDQAKLIQQINAEKLPIIIVDAPIPVKVQITEKIPLGLLIEAGVAKFEKTGF